MSLLTRFKTALSALKELPKAPIESWLMGLPTIRALSQTGIEIGEDDAIKIMAVYACIRVIATEIAASPVQFLKNTAGGKERVPGCMAALLRYEPNPEMTASDFKKAMTLNLELWGNAYAEIVRNRAGEVVSLWPIPAWRVTKKRDEKNNLYYVVMVEGGDAVTLKERQMLHLRTMGSGVTGMSFVVLARDALGLALAAEEYGAKFFKNGALASGIATYPRALSQECRFVKPLLHGNQKSF
ncbi:MAG: phage portal protein [Cloacibacillus sp.]